MVPAALMPPARAPPNWPNSQAGPGTYPGVHQGPGKRRRAWVLPIQRPSHASALAARLSTISSFQLQIVDTHTHTHPHTPTHPHALTHPHTHTHSLTQNTVLRLVLVLSGHGASGTRPFEAAGASFTSQPLAVAGPVCFSP
jgi:hypothetical protein